MDTLGARPVLRGGRPFFPPYIVRWDKVSADVQKITAHTCARTSDNQATQRLHSTSVLGLPYRILNINHKKELLRGLWVEPCFNNLLRSGAGDLKQSSVDGRSDVRRRRDQPRHPKKVETVDSDILQCDGLSIWHQTFM